MKYHLNENVRSILLKDIFVIILCKNTFSLMIYRLLIVIRLVCCVNLSKGLNKRNTIIVDQRQLKNIYMR